MGGDEDVHPRRPPEAAPPNLRVVGKDTYPDWQAIYVDNIERIYRLMYNKVGNRPDAEDLTSDVFHAALGPLRTTASVGEVRSYLLTTAQTTLARYWKRRYGIEVTSIDPHVDMAGAVESSVDAQPSRRVEHILAALPDRYRRILELRFLESCSLRDAAAALDITVGNAKVLQHRALRYAAQLAEEGQ